MVISSEILDYLGRGWEVAAEFPSIDVNQRVYIVVIPHAPNSFKHPELWSRRSQDVLPGRLILNSSDLIQRYEIRYLQHHMKYTNTDWGWDYDYVLEDKSTRVHRIFVQTQEGIETELINFLGNLPQLEISGNFDSSLVCSPITSMLDRPEDYPHLWEVVDVLDLLSTKSLS